MVIDKSPISGRSHVRTSISNLARRLSDFAQADLSEKSEKPKRSPQTVYFLGQRAIAPPLLVDSPLVGASWEGIDRFIDFASSREFTAGNESSGCSGRSVTMSYLKDIDFFVQRRDDHEEVRCPYDRLLAGADDFHRFVWAEPERPDPAQRRFVGRVSLCGSASETPQLEPFGVLRRSH